MSYVHISGWVQVTEPNGPSGPIDPGFGRPGWSPVDPGFGHPGWAPARPGHDLPGGGHISNKPPGAPILPPSIDNGLPPMGGAPPHPWTPGHWQPIDPGWGKPPLWGFIPVDPGFGIPETPPPVIGGGPAPTPPTKPPVVGGGPIPPPTIGGGPITGPGGGTWVPVDPDFGQPGCPGGKPHPPIWAWIPHPPTLPDNTLPPVATPK